MTAMVNVATKRKFRADRDGYVTTARGPELLDTPLLNKGTAYSREERAALGLEGLLPSAVQTLDDQVARAYEQYHEQPTERGLPVDRRPGPGGAGAGRSGAGCRRRGSDRRLRRRGDPGDR